MFDISSISTLTRELIKVSLNSYYMLCQNWSPSLNSNLDYKMQSNLYEIHTGYIYSYHQIIIIHEADVLRLCALDSFFMS